MPMRPSSGPAAAWRPRCNGWPSPPLLVLATSRLLVVRWRSRQSPVLHVPPAGLRAEWPDEREGLGRATGTCRTTQRTSLVYFVYYLPQATLGLYVILEPLSRQQLFATGCHSSQVAHRASPARFRELSRARPHRGRSRGFAPLDYLLSVSDADGRREALGLDPCITADTPSEPTSSYKNKPNGPPRWWEGGESRLRMLF